ncbi:response regulator receiver protein [Deinococcus sp. Arct2-2]|uniref:AfsR/SARP family transcriptional regulator n=1 Tax=Deinococcus sp. Arct2-2 TaxID=2568653 RepID=UPI0010A51DA3|nr:BTAD domain-containing putative transcriptional regulator [Deinococcus sp. Arct2-2]THF69177.1 response regulator receiver protein [Deinococcus sp. Arct2-2]
MHDLDIRTFGQVRVTISGQDVVWQAASARNLLFFLLSFPEGRGRHDIALALWPDDDEASPVVSARFRVALHRLRAALGDIGSVIGERERYRLSPEVLAASDVHTLSAAEHVQGAEPRQAALQQAVMAYRGEYLPDHRAEWAITAREQHKATYVRAALERAMQHCVASQCGLAIGHLAQALSTDPLIGENYHQDLMTCLANVESHYSAVEHYRRFIKFLRDDLSDTPMLETVTLAERLKAGDLICPHKIGTHAPCTKHLIPKLGSEADGAEIRPETEPSQRRFPSL